jgi:hypothetical protein
MLYQIHEWQRAFLGPMSYFAQASAKMFSEPGSLLAQMPGAPRLAAGWELLHRLGKDYEKPAFGIHDIEVDGHTVAVVEQTALTLPFCQLRRFKRFSDDAAAIEALLAAHGFVLERSAVYGMQPKSSRLLDLGQWFLTHRRERAMWWYNHVFMPLGLRFQKPLQWREGLPEVEGVDEVLLVCRRLGG